METQGTTQTKTTKKAPPTKTVEKGEALMANSEPTSKAVAPKAETALATTSEHDQEVLNSDIIIPKVLLMQGLSDFVADRKAQIGDMVRSTTGQKLGDDKTPLEFVPLKIQNAWTIQEKIGEKFEFRSVEPRNAKNEDLEWTFTKNGTDWRRVKTINVFALLVKDLKDFATELETFKETGVLNIEKTLMPVVISFKSTSFNAGKTVATFFTKIKGMLKHDPTLASYKYTLPLSCEETENDKGRFFILNVGESKPIAKEFLVEAQGWYNILNSAKSLKVDMSDEGGTTEGSVIDVKEVSAF